MERPSNNQPQQRETKQQATTNKREQPQAKQQSTSVDIGEAGKNRNGRRRPTEMRKPTTATDYKGPANHQKRINNQTKPLEKTMQRGSVRVGRK
jgi:hypothetical protein